MITLRELQKKDLELMKECFNDKDNTKFLRIGHISLSNESFINFINKKNTPYNYNFAIVDSNDNWCGTISLKNVDYDNKKAEYAIITDKRIQGSGIPKTASLELISFAFNELRLHSVYLNVMEENIRAQKFYDKLGFSLIGISHDSLFLNDSYHNLLWYELINKSDNNIEKELR